MVREYLEGMVCSMIHNFRKSDILLIFAVLAILAYFLMLSPDTYSFSGSEIYAAVSRYNSFEKRGFCVKMRVIGTYTDSNKNVEIAGSVISATGGSFVIRANGNDFSVGGPMAGLEDIAAERLYIEVVSPSVIHVDLEEMEFGSFEELCKQLDDVANIIANDFEIVKVSLDGNIAADFESSPTRQIDIINMLTLVPDEELFLYSNGMKISGLVSLEELCKFGVGPVRGKTSKSTLKIAVSQEIDEDSALRLKDGLPENAIKTSFKVIKAD